MGRSLEKLSKIVGPALGETIYLVLVTQLLSVVLGFILATIIYLTKEDGLWPNKMINNILSFFVNIVRSFPFIILVVSIIPFTRMIVGTVIGNRAALVPLTISATALNTRMIENSFNEVDYEVVKAVKSFGANNMQIMREAVFPESVPAVISSLTVSTINVLNTTAIAGSLGAGGLGSVAINFGYHTFDNVIMYGIVIILICIVQIFQMFSQKIYKKSLR